MRAGAACESSEVKGDTRRKANSSAGEILAAPLPGDEMQEYRRAEISQAFGVPLLLTLAAQRSAAIAPTQSLGARTRSPLAPSSPR